MDYEQLHKDTIAKLQEMVNSGKITVEIARGICADFVPESEDEKIRKWLIGYFNQYIIDGMPQVFGNGLNVKDVIAWLEKQDEQKPVDKVEPKFHKGDWVVSPNGVYWHIDKISNNRYEVTSNTGESSNWQLDTNIYHKFTIQDAKDGDVLYLQKYKKKHIIIYKGITNEGFGTFVDAYCAYNGIVDVFCFAYVDKYVNITYKGIMPATKEQRDFLFQKMKEAGYEWDANAKQLNKNE